MSVALTKYPVVTSSGKVRNIFAGFQAVELEFKREDIAVVGVGSGVDAKILITINANIVSSLAVGEWVYLYSEGATYAYDNSYQITTIVFSSPNTEITVDADFIEVSTGGYCNYKQNWFLESKLVRPSNNAVLNYPSLLQTDGNPNGVIEVNTSMMVDFLKNIIETTSQEITGATQDCKVMYRESWREDDTASFILVDQEAIIILFAAENSEIEDFVSGFDFPKIWEGYPFAINLLHSLENSSGERIIATFDESDINKDNITIDNPLVSFGLTDFGILQTNFEDKTKVIDDNTKFIIFNADSSDVADFETGDFNDTDFFTINTP